MNLLRHWLGHRSFGRRGLAMLALLLLAALGGMALMLLSHEPAPTRPKTATTIGPGDSAKTPGETTTRINAPRSVAPPPEDDLGRVGKLDDTRAVEPRPETGLPGHPRPKPGLPDHVVPSSSSRSFREVTVTVTGQVEDQSGAGVSDVAIFVRCPRLHWYLSLSESEPAARSSSDGSFRFQVEIRSVMQDERVGLDLWPVKTGLASEGPYRLRDLAGETPQAHVRLILVPGGFVSGRVSDTKGFPLVGAKVTATFSNPKRKPYVGTLFPAVTDTEGRYELDALPPGNWEINAALDGYDPSAGAKVEVNANIHCEAPTIVLTKNSWITLRLLRTNGTELDVPTAAEATVRIEFCTATGRESWIEVPAKVSSSGLVKVQVFLYTPTSLTVRLPGFHESDRVTLRFIEGEVNDAGEVRLAPKE